jgi:hypothetical protein
MEKKSVTI